MARYAEWNKFIGTLKTDTWGVTNVNEVGIAFEKATADVVPKSEYEALNEMLEAAIAGQETLQNALAEAKTEVAREIFEEIEKISKAPYGYLCLSNDEYAELKKKYI